MNNQLKREFILDLIEEVLGVPRGTVEEHFYIHRNSLADSLDNIEIIMLVEDRLRIELDEKELTKCETVCDFINYIINTGALDHV